MATKYYAFVGKVAWPKVRNPDETEWGKFWSIDVYMDKENEELLKSSGSEIKPIKGDKTYPGETGYRFRRPVTKVINGKNSEFDPPKVYDVNGEVFNENIGNGSTAEVVVAIYETRKGSGPVGHRLESVKVLELVPYAGKETIRVGKNASENASEAKPW